MNQSISNRKKKNRNNTGKIILFICSVCFLILLLCFTTFFILYQLKKKGEQDIEEFVLKTEINVETELVSESLVELDREALLSDYLQSELMLKYPLIHSDKDSRVLEKSEKSVMFSKDVIPDGILYSSIEDMDFDGNVELHVIRNENSRVQEEYQNGDSETYTKESLVHNFYWEVYDFYNNGIVLRDSQLLLRRDNGCMMFLHYDLVRKELNNQTYICVLNDGNAFDCPLDQEFLIGHYEDGKIKIDLSLSNPWYSQAGHWGIYNCKDHYLHATHTVSGYEQEPTVYWELDGKTVENADSQIEEIYPYSLNIDPEGKALADEEVSARLSQFGLIRDNAKEAEVGRWRLKSDCIDKHLMCFDFDECIDIDENEVYAGTTSYKYELIVGV